MKRMILMFSILTVLLVACAKVPEQVQPTPSVPAETPKSTEPAPTAPQPTTQTIGFQGKVLAGTTTPYVEFNKADYELALKTKPYVVLYFYANWCPICKAEQPNTFAAFNELQRTDMVGFRVNYRDSETDDDEVALAREFGITYQHTKVVLKDGEKVLKDLSTWDKQEYLDNLGKI